MKVKDVMTTNIDACEWAAAADGIHLSQYADGGRSP
jgi:deoxyribodipyrimidine photolyase-like uncharacterized protein